MYHFYIAFNEHNKAVACAQEELQNPFGYPNLIYSDILNRFLADRKIKNLNEMEYVVENWKAFSENPHTYRNCGEMISQDLKETFG